jgi:hypothetical protein
MQSNARKTGWTIQSLLIEHTELDKTPARLASEHVLKHCRVSSGGVQSGSDERDGAGAAKQ